MKIRVPARVVEFMQGSQISADILSARREGKPVEPVLDREEVGYWWIETITGKRNADRSVSVDVTTKDEALGLAEWGDYCANAASDNASDGDMDARADVNSGNALVRRAYAVAEKLAS